MSIPVDLAQLRAAYRRARQPAEPQVTVLDGGAAQLPEPDHFVALAAGAGLDTRLADEWRLRWAMRGWALRAASSPLRWRPTRDWMPGLALACSLLALLVVLWPRPQPSAPVYRGVEPVAVTDPAAASSLLAGDRLRYLWPPGARRVQLHLFDSELEPLWQGPWTTKTEQVLPTAVREQLQPEQRYYWRLRADNGFEQAWETLQSFELAGDGHSADE